MSELQEFVNVMQNFNVLIIIFFLYSCVRSVCHLARLKFSEFNNESYHLH